MQKWERKKGVKLDNFHNIVYSYSFKFLNFYLIQAYDFPDYMFGLLWYKQQRNKCKNGITIR